jgi:hypothetical protein
VGVEVGCAMSSGDIHADTGLGMRVNQAVLTDRDELVVIGWIIGRITVKQDDTALREVQDPRYLGALGRILGDRGEMRMRPL